MIVKFYPVGDIGTNCYLVCDEKSSACCLIDPGAEAEKLEAAVQASGKVLSCILLTHGHFDHTGAVDELVEKHPGVPVYLHQSDVRYGHGREISQLYPALKCKVTPYREGDKVRVGSLEFEVLETPGHTPGSVTLKAGDTLFTGDTLFAGSIGRTDLPGGSYADMFQSLKRLAKLEGNYTVYSGHSEPTDLSAERAENPYLRQAASKTIR